MRLLGVDVGRVRTGLALSDPHGVSCSPLPAIEERDPERTIAKLASVVAEGHVGLVVVGLPRPLGGGTNEQTELVLSFVDRLRAAVTVPVVTWDERYTSKLAESQWARKSPRRRGVSPDSVAACYILQNYLDWLRNRSQTEEAG